LKKDHQVTPLYTKLKQYAAAAPISFHVPGHKNGLIFPKRADRFFGSILPIDVTEITGMDDLHAPKEVIAEAESLAADYFGSMRSFFLIGGSTVGNLAMILAVCVTGDKIIVQRNCHKSIMNGLELANADPIFITPDYDEAVNRYTSPSPATLKQALEEHKDAKAVVLTYPDYFGRTYAIKEMIELAHTYQIPVLVDEAHGVHFSLGIHPFPHSALKFGADAVVHSAHKTLPAMTMTSYLHINSSFVAEEKVAHFLQILQSSSPSYPLMASLDIARSFLATLTSKSVSDVLTSVKQVRQVMASLNACVVLPISEKDDPLKITLSMKKGISSALVASLFEKNGVFPELVTHNQLLFIHGLAPFHRLSELKKAVTSINDELKIKTNHATIDMKELFSNKVHKLALTYPKMSQQTSVLTLLDNAKGKIAAEAVIPYPPGIPFILKGEEITETHIQMIKQLIKQGVTFQHCDINNGIKVYNKGEEDT